VVLQACLNGNRSRLEHEGVPITPDQLASDARSCRSAGARSLHFHPRDENGLETLEPGACAEALRAVRRVVTTAELGLSTGIWIEGTAAATRAAVESWHELPDLVSVNLSEDGALELIELAMGRGIDVEAGLATVADAEKLVASQLAVRCSRALVEVELEDPAEAVALAAEIERVVYSTGLEQLHHGIGAATWDVLEAARDRRHSIRVGLEDTLVMPDGSRARSNARLVRAAAAL
jgi:uncharacterized protein (DUF849 family)